MRHPLSLPIEKNVWVVCTSKPECACSQFYVKRRSGRACIYEKPACCSRVQLRKALFTHVKTTKRTSNNFTFARPLMGTIFLVSEYFLFLYIMFGKSYIKFFFCFFFYLFLSFLIFFSMCRVVVVIVVVVVVVIAVFKNFFYLFPFVGLHAWGWDSGLLYHSCTNFSII